MQISLKLQWAKESLHIRFFVSLNINANSIHKQYTVELRSKGPGRKGNPPIREMISGPISYVPIYIYISYKGISVHGKN